MTVYEIITNEIPYEVFNQYQHVFKVASGYHPKFKHSIPYAYRKHIEKSWSEDPFNGPSFSEIVDHLEKDPNFITLNVDKEEYLNYISYIKYYQQISILLV